MSPEGLIINDKNMFGLKLFKSAEETQSQKKAPYEKWENGNFSINVKDYDEARSIAQTLYEELEGDNDYKNVGGDKILEDELGSFLNGKGMRLNNGVYLMKYNPTYDEVTIELTGGEGEGYEQKIEEAIKKALSFLGEEREKAE